MARHSWACVFALLALSAAKDQSRWSRQISSYTSDLSDWVPLPGPVEREPVQLPQIKRQAVAEPRILAEPVFPGFQRPTGFSQEFPGRTYYNPAMNRQLYLQSLPAVPSAPQNYLSDQGFSQGIRFGLAQPNFALNQGYVAPQYNFDAVPQPKPRPQPTLTNPVSFKNNLPSPQAKPFNGQVPKKIESPKFVDGYRVENVSSFPFLKKPQSLQKLKYDTLDKIPKTEMVPPRAKSEKEEVQLLYVPLESLNRGQFNFRSPLNSQQLLNTDIYNQNVQRTSLSNQALPKQTFAADFQRPISKQIDNYNPEYFSNFNSQYKEPDQVPKFSTISTPAPTSPSTTVRPKKLKPHQPPLAIFLTQEAKKGGQLKVGDVLSSLKNAESIAVLDSVNPLTAPKVFIGPSNLGPPENFVKFELPYLSNIEHSDKKLRQLPFFVAPLSYNTPNGFAKIPFPSPHVGSVVINSQIKDTSSTLPPATADVIPNSYSSAPHYYKPEKPATQKPSVSFYSTSAPKTNAPLNRQSNYYSFEPQTVSTIRPPKEPQASIVSSTPKTGGSYFLSNIQDQYNPAIIPNFDVQDNFKTQEPVKAFNYVNTEPTTLRTTTQSSTTTRPSTYPSQLLETHNPYSINQAFHFSTPLDYHNLFDENYATPGFPQSSSPSHPAQPSQPSPPPTPISSTPSSTHKPVEQITEKTYQSSPAYVQNYSPEIHYESELTNARYPVTNTNDYPTKTEMTSDYSQSSPQDNTQNTYSVSNVNPPVEYNSNIKTQSPIYNTQTVDNEQSETDGSTKSPYLYNQYETSYEEEKQTSPTTSTTTTTRRTPIRNRGRPRYTTPKADSNESTIRNVATRRPLRERKPLPPRNKYEPNKITTERATRKPIDSSESTTKYSRSRTRGRVHFKPTDSEEYYGKSGNKGTGAKDDLAYQRDVLHQNYPVTLMERSSTVDIEAITEPVPKISSTKDIEAPTEVYDTENAYSYDRASVSQHVPNPSSREETYTRTEKAETQTETYVPKVPASKEEYTYQSRSSLAPVDAYSQFEESSEEESYVKQTTPLPYTEKPEYSFGTETFSAVSEVNPSSISISDLSSKPEEVTTVPDIEITKVSSRETTLASVEEQEENIVQTTPSYNRVRVRPGVVRQYHQTSTETTRAKPERRRPSQPVTYRPAFDRRRTTMRIEEIEADLKTKQVHSRPEVQEHRHPVYRPEPTTEPAVTTSSSQEATTKRGAFRRRRPTYTTTSTEASSGASTKRTYEVKNRFRGRRPTDRPTTEKSEAQTDASTTTARNNVYSRYTRPRLSERYNKKPEPEDSEDQDSNYSINRPKYVEPETEQWSPKISTDSFKPYNPNDIIDEKKTTTARNDEELDIITAKNNEYDDILISVTPATNNRVNKKIPDIPPTLEALVEQSKTTKSDSGDTMSTFETMLEEVMKSLEEQDEDEYTSKVMKHKGGEIGEIPPERIISSGDIYSRSTTVEEHEATTVDPATEDSTHKEEEKEQKNRRRGFWKKVKVRPATTESIEAAESQYYTNTVNRLGHPVSASKAIHDKLPANDKLKVTTYKPPYQFFKDIFDEVEDEILPTIDIPKINKTIENTSQVETEEVKTTPEVKTTTVTETSVAKETPTEAVPNPGEMDLGTGSPDPTLDSIYSTPTEATTKAAGIVDRSDGFSLMDYLFGATTDEEESHTDYKKYNQEQTQTTEKAEEIQITTEQSKPRLPTTESTYIPEEITAVPIDDDKTETATPDFEIKKINASEVRQPVERVVESTEKSVQIETYSVSSFMNPNNVISTSMSTEISHETEICYRGKCIKTSKDIL
ncbi:mucin-5AC-like [Pectinophora gossypiella]|uniref:mucin-5AC-like n=1 Tax=Pectinophora gossypiella TaxID=13191 RepID=UPI00214EC4F1|nr:mucin-5AC-like [Pectinophora gossypiella]XP_049881195.1 mucin-5AC-like [Pectinophora gossypiella]